MQTTINESITLSGVGLHTGQVSIVVINPAPANHGITMTRVDCSAQKIPVLWSNIQVSPLNTCLKGELNVSIATIEHLMAALSGCGIHNADIELNGREIPILDGSSAQFVQSILKVGVKVLSAPLRAIKILRTCEVYDGDSFASLSPAANFQLSFEIDFPDAAIGRQKRSMSMEGDTFIRNLSFTRTFCRKSDVELMHSKGLALGGTLENALVVDGHRVMSPGGMRCADEPVRHKMLDAVGDLYTVGAPIFGKYTGYKSGHALTNKLLRALFSDENAWGWVDCTHAMSQNLPGLKENLNTFDYVA